MIEHILVDLDGVLANFFDAALKLWEFDAAKYPAGEWDIPTVLQITPSDFWSRIDKDENFWRSLDPYPWTVPIIGWLDSTGLPWTVATSPSRNPQCASQKIEWMRKHFDRPQFTDYMIGSRKELMASQKTLLIDDSDTNVEKFINADGIAYLFPQHWNKAGGRLNPMMAMIADFREMEILP